MANDPAPKNMSQLQRNIRDCRITSPTDLLVLDKIAQRINFKEQDSCRPSYRKISEDTRFAVSTIKASVKRLRAAGYIRVRKRANTSNYFYVQYDFIAAEAAAVNEERKIAKRHKDMAKWEAEEQASTEFLAKDAGIDSEVGGEPQSTTMTDSTTCLRDEAELVLPAGFLSGGKR